MKESYTSILSYKEMYCESSKKSFDSHSILMQQTNHKIHNEEPNYWNILLKPVKENKEKWTGKNALDFGCGCGRNILNLYKMANFNRVDGVDICGENAKFALGYIKSHIEGCTSKTWENNGWDVNPCEDNCYDFIMSHQVVQHISNYDVRYSLLVDLYRVLKPNGILSIHFLNLGDSVDYYHSGPFQDKNVIVEDKYQVIKDLENIGYRNIKCIESLDYFHKRPEFYFYGEK